MKRILLAYEQKNDNWEWLLFFVVLQGVLHVESVHIYIYIYMSECEILETQVTYCQGHQKKNVCVIHSSSNGYL